MRGVTLSEEWMVTGLGCGVDEREGRGRVVCKMNKYNFKKKENQAPHVL